MYVQVRSTPLPVTVTTRIITFLVGDPYNPSFATVTGRGVDPMYKYSCCHRLTIWFSTSHKVRISGPSHDCLKTQSPQLQRKRFSRRRPSPGMVAKFKKGHNYQKQFEDMDMGVNPKIGGFTLQIIHFNRVFHEINHPFWGTATFWKHPYMNHHFSKKDPLTGLPYLFVGSYQPVVRISSIFFLG